MSVQPKEIKSAQPARLPHALVRPIFTPSSDVGPAFCWISPYTGDLSIETDALSAFPRVHTSVAGQATLLRLGRPIWVAKHVLAGYPADLTDAAWDVIEAIFEDDYRRGLRSRWLLSPPVKVGEVEIV